jgi:Protein of unknown function with PCYCGC motif
VRCRFQLGLAIPFLFFALCLTAQSTSPGSSVSTPIPQKQGAPPMRSKDHPYHKHPARHELPDTLDPEQLKDDPQAYVAYSLAAKIRALLYQQPCLCPCGKERGHKSLLDCFTGIHGRNCDECKLQVFFCYEQSKKGWSAKRIRQAMFQFKFLAIDFDEYARAQWRAMTGKE